MHCVGIVQARVGSSRLPGKALLPIAGRPLLDHVLERVEHVSGLSARVFATSVAERDGPLADLAAHRGWLVTRGSEHDVLGRFVAAVRMVEADAVMRLTGDCPLLCPEVCALVLRAYAETYHDYVSNDTRVSGYPDGTDCEVFSISALRTADLHAVDGRDREHVTPWISRELRTQIVSSPTDWRRYKLSVDTEEDLRYVRRVRSHLQDGKFTLSDTLEAAAALERSGVAFDES